MERINEEKFYEIGETIVSKYNEVRFASNSPALIVPEERETETRKNYFESLSKRIDGGKITKYMFSREKTKSMILESADTNSVIDGYKELLNKDGLDLRYSEDEFDSCIIGDNEITILKRGDERFLLGKEETEKIKEVFDQLFSSSSNDHYSLIEEIKGEL